MRATLVKRRTDDGFMEMNDDVPIGKVYEVEAGSQRTMQMVHVPTGTPHSKVMIRDVAGGWLAVEMLRLEGPA
jgi:hypothetical protein